MHTHLSASGIPCEYARTSLRTTDIERWTDVLREQLFGLSTSLIGDTPFEGALTSCQVGGSVLASVSGSPASAWCGPDTSQERIHSDHVFKLLWQLDGHSTVRQPSFEATLHTGEMAMYRVSHNYQLVASGPFRVMLLSLDLAGDPGRVSLAERFAGKPLPASASLCAARAVVAHLLDMEADDTLDVAVQSVADLVFRSLQWAGFTEPALPSSQRFEKACHHVRQHLADPSLSPQTLADTIGVSRRCLYGEFAQRGLSPSAFIRDMRLDHCRALLRDRTQGHRSVTEIALTHGFSDSAGFSRAYRQRFGNSPIAERREGLITADRSLAG